MGDQEQATLIKKCPLCGAENALHLPPDGKPRCRIVGDDDEDESVSLVTHDEAQHALHKLPVKDPHWMTLVNYLAQQEALGREHASLERDLAEARGDARAKHGVSELAIRERDAAKRERDEVCARLSSAYGTCEMLERESKTLQGQRDAALRDLAELRGAARAFLDAMDDADTTVSNASDAQALNSLSAKLRALLPAEPPKEASDGK